MEILKKKLQSIPIGVSGIALGIAGITNVWASLSSIHVAVAGSIVAIMLLGLILSKYIVHPDLFLKEISHPVLGSMIPTIDMAVMVVASIIVSFFPVLGKVLWLSAVVVHTVFFVFFIYYRAKDFDLNHMVPSWFVPPIGIVTACVTSVQMGFPNAAEILFMIGFSFYVILFPIMIYRMFFGDRIQKEILPSFAIMAAPPNLCLAGYLSIADQHHLFFIISLSFLALLMTLFVYISFFQVLNIPFSPIFAAYAFPLAIGATAIRKLFVFLTTLTAPQELIWKEFYIGLLNTIEIISWIELFIATIVIAYILIKMKYFLWKNVFHT